jgi:hypothetical protein
MRHVVLVGALAAAVALVGCGSGESTVGRTTEVSRCATDGPEPCDPTPTTAPPAPTCGVVTADLVTSAVGEPATYLGRDASGCGYSAGRWTLAVAAVPYDPASQGQGALSDHLDNDRSGLWQVRGAVVADGLLYSYWLRNGTTGADTYPPASGPEQRPLTSEAAAALEEAITTAG